MENKDPDKMLQGTFSCKTIYNRQFQVSDNYKINSKTFYKILSTFIRAASSKNVCKIHRFKSSCAWVKYHPSFCSPFIQSVLCNDSVSGQWRPWTDFMDAQADLSLHSLHMPKDKFFSYGTAHHKFFFSFKRAELTRILLNNLICHTHFWLSANQITSYNVFVQIHKLNDKQCRSWSDGFFRSHLIWIYTVCKSRGCCEQQDMG